MNKRCCKCGQWLTVDSFSKDKSRKDGLCPYCKICKKTCAAKFYKNNKEEIGVHVAEYYQGNKERVLKYQVLYYRANKEKVQIRGTKYRKNNKEKIATCNARYRGNNKESIAIRDARYRIEYNKNNRGKLNAKLVKYRAMKLNQTPVNADPDEIRCLF